MLLQRPIGRIRIVAQRTIPAASPEHRGIRMDVEVEELGEDSGNLPILNIYDLEPHQQREYSLPRRNRFYQAKIDGRYLKSGEKDFSGLPDLYVITILNYDPFGYDYMMYTVRNRCEEIPEMPYEDGLRFIYFNTKGNKGGSEDIRKMLKYIQNSREENVTNDSTRALHEYVSRVKVQPEVRIEYMKFDEIIAWERREAAEEAREEVREEIEKKMAEAVKKTEQEATYVTKRNDIFELLEEHGEIPEDLRQQIKKEESLKVLKEWLKLAAKSVSMEDFREKIQSIN